MDDLYLQAQLQRLLIQKFGKTTFPQTSSLSYQKTKKDRSKKDKEYRERLRARAIDALGGVCRVCGMDDKDVLEIDHIIPLLRRTNKVKSKSSVYKDIATGSDDVSKYQLLCANCHTKKTRANNEYGYRGL